MVKNKWIKYKLSREKCMFVCMVQLPVYIISIQGDSDPFIYQVILLLIFIEREKRNRIG